MEQIKSGTTMQAEVNRLSSFSDSVISIAITLLVLTLTVPEVSSVMAGVELLPKLLQMAPKVFFYVLSFTMIGVFWVSHHELFSRIKRIDTNFKFINLFHLLNLSFLPFPTAVMGKFFDQPVAAAFFAISMSLCSFSQLAVYLYAQKKGFFEGDITNATQYVVLPFIFLLSWPLAFISPLLAEVFWTSMLLGRILFVR